MKPVIGITGPDRFPRWGWWAASLGVRLAGGRPVRLTPNSPRPPVPLAGIIIGGGDDIDPSLYGGEPEPASTPDARRDAFEARMIRRAMERRLPILGICRGAQLLNVVLGGTLYPDIRHLRHKTSNRNMILPRKRAHLKRGSRVLRTMRRDPARINSLHHQAMDDIGRGLRVVGRDADGFVQAVEATSKRFIVGVQWHPEYIPQFQSQRRLFRALVRAAARNRHRSRLAGPGPDHR